MEKKICRYCNGKKRLEKHHIFPKCHFGARGNNSTIWVCRSCHIDLEHFIMKHEGVIHFFHHDERRRRTRMFYLWCVLKFGREKDEGG